MALVDDIRDLLCNTLVLEAETATMGSDSPLLGAVRELDSVGVMAVVTALEDQFDIEIDDDEISTEVFKTLGSLTSFVAEKVG
ncbi:acyl carrier protein [Pseudomaricurvus alkylphenolicus]|uniref:acyl carrier protein n=1 Tax=Pseudomaricurvus alkylphenolicus TaxID=1306991 RepID=UPI0014224367|nr:phosphopantetheine-binding protein [Pseudomaricurvus alkylphenolicus]NIB43094.1 acyl carrier protein [Pseudomaricurvus alkylphenolicus]